MLVFEFCKRLVLIIKCLCASPCIADVNYNPHLHTSFNGFIILIKWPRNVSLSVKILLISLQVIEHVTAVQCDLLKLTTYILLFR